MPMRHCSLTYPPNLVGSVRRARRFPCWRGPKIVPLCQRFGVRPRAPPSPTPFWSGFHPRALGHSADLPSGRAGPEGGSLGAPLGALAPGRPLPGRRNPWEGGGRRSAQGDRGVTLRFRRCRPPWPRPPLSPSAAGASGREAGLRRRVGTWESPGGGASAVRSRWRRCNPKPPRPQYARAGTV